MVEEAAEGEVQEAALDLEPLEAKAELQQELLVQQLGTRRRGARQAVARLD